MRIYLPSLSVVCCQNVSDLLMLPRKAKCAVRRKRSVENINEKTFSVP